MTHPTLDKNVFNACLEALESHFNYKGNAFAKEMMREGYYDVLKGLSESELLKGAKQAIANCKYFPTAVQIKDFAYDGKTDEERAQEALATKAIAALPSFEMNMTFEEAAENKRQIARYCRIRRAQPNLTHEEALEAMSDDKAEGVGSTGENYDELISPSLPICMTSAKHERQEREKKIAEIERNRIAALKYLQQCAEMDGEEIEF